MTMLSKAITGKIKKPVFMCIYGETGLGKTTFANSAPKTIFISTEEGTNEFDTTRVKVESYQEVIQTLDELIETKTDFKTVALDSLDHLEPMIYEAVCKDGGKANIEDFGYGKGYALALDKWSEVLTKLRAVRDVQNKHVIMISHAHVKTFTDPHLNEQYDRFELKLNKKASALVKETVDLLMLVKKDVALKKDKNGKTQAFDLNTRALFTEYEIAFDAKNRYGLPPKMDFPAENAFSLLEQEIDKAHGQTPETVINEIKSKARLINDTDLLDKIKASTENAGIDITKLRAIDNRLEVILKEQRQ